MSKPTHHKYFLLSYFGGTRQSPATSMSGSPMDHYLKEKDSRIELLATGRSEHHQRLEGSPNADEQKEAGLAIAQMSKHMEEHQSTFNPHNS